MRIMNKTDIGEILFCDPNRKDEEAGGLSVSTDLNFVLHFRPCDTFDGEFGFDWMREKYIYVTTKKSIDIETGEDVDVPVDPICLDGYQEKLKSQYKVGAFDGLEKPYFIPWLSMFSNHKEKTGNDVELKLEVHQINKKWKQSKVTFECPEGITVEPPVLDIKKNKDLSIKIQCKCIHEGGYIKAKTICDKNNPIEQCVGILNLFPNKEFPLKIKWVPLLRKEYLEEDRSFIKQKKDAIDKYLKSSSLQQAMIMPTIVMEEELIINELQWAREGKIKNGKIQSDNDLLSEYKKTFELKEENEFRGVVTIICNTSHEDENKYGAGVYNPTWGNSCIVYKRGLTRIAKDGSNSYNTFAHEIGHVLGLDHTFERKILENEGLYNDYKEKLSAHESLLDGMQQEVNGEMVSDEEYWTIEEAKYRRIGDINNANLCKLYIEQAVTSREKIENNIGIYKPFIESYERLLSNFHILFKEGMTDNIMDYCLNDKPIVFFKWQWGIMQKEILDIHS